MKSVRNIIPLFGLFFGLQSLPQVLKNPSAVIYSGPGTCDGCSEAVQLILQKMGFSTEFIKPGELTSVKLGKVQLYVQPGGTDNPDDILNALTPLEIKSLQRFVALGGRYLGICSGGYLAGQFINDGKQTKAFGLLPLTVDQEQSDTAPTTASVLWQQRLHQIYVQDAPSFALTELPEADVWATYKVTGHGAALINKYGQGKVGVIGPHVEAPEDWYLQDHLLYPGSKINLGIDFINALMNSN